MASTVIGREIPLAVAAVVLFGVLAWAGLTIWAGIGLAIGAVAALGRLMRWATEGRNSELAGEVSEYTDLAPDRSAVPRWFEPVHAALGLTGVLVGAHLPVTKASAVAERLGVPQLIIGFTLVALGTSLPELVTTVQAMRRAETDLVVGNLFGSNLFNSLAGGAVLAFASPAGVETHVGGRSLRR